MDFNHLLNFIDEVDKRIRNNYGDYPDESKRILARSVKLSEEVGELSSAILAHNSLQRDKKLENHSQENLEEEFADVIITTMLLAKSTKIDIRSALRSKIDKINNRPKRI